MSTLANAKTREIKTLYVERNYTVRTKWVDIAPRQADSLKEIIELLSKSKTGNTILKLAQSKAAEYGKTLEEVIIPGDTSITDTTLVRKFSASRPSHVVYEVKSKVYLSRHLSVVEAVLDLAHELTHFVYRTPFNPYRGDFTLEKFVKSTVEGRGGEVEAYLTECTVLAELFPKKSQYHENCNRVIDERSGKYSMRKGIERFYRVGSFYKKFDKELTIYGITAKNLPELSDSQTLFFSSAYGLPYPVAALREFVSIMGRACENDLKRLSIFKQNIDRLPASKIIDPSETNYRKLSSQYNDRCRHFTAS